MDTKFNTVTCSMVEYLIERCQVMQDLKLYTCAIDKDGKSAYCVRTDACKERYPELLDVQMAVSTANLNEPEPASTAAGS